MTSNSKKPGLYANIQAKRERIAHGSGEHMRKPGEQGAPTAEDFAKAEKTARHPKAASGTAGKSAAGKRRSRKE